MTQLQLTPPPMTPADWCGSWGVALLDEIPHPGLATAKDLAGLSAEARRWPGRNHPGAGAWLYEKYGRTAWCADPMFGAGALWLKTGAQPFTGDVERGQDARSWRPAAICDLVMFSPPFLQNHSAGATAHQQAIREKKNLHAMQEFGAAPGNIGRAKTEAELFLAMHDVYAQVRTYTAAHGRMVVILRNLIRKGREVDHVGLHMIRMIKAGWRILGAHPRALRPTGYQQWKVARDPATPWIKTEWAVVAVPNPAKEIPW